VRHSVTGSSAANQRRSSGRRYYLILSAIPKHDILNPRFGRLCLRKRLRSFMMDDSTRVPFAKNLILHGPRAVQSTSRRFNLTADRGNLLPEMVHFPILKHGAAYASPCWQSHFPGDP
jgi:hypothetical protein